VLLAGDTFVHENAMNDVSSVEVCTTKPAAAQAAATPHPEEKLPLPRGHRREYCTFCRCERVFQKRSFDHSFHPILAILTLGAWALVWIPFAIRHSLTQPWRCGWCGHRRRIDYSPHE
jgi:hypothetical protein